MRSSVISAVDKPISQKDHQSLMDAIIDVGRSAHRDYMQNAISSLASQITSTLYTSTQFTPGCTPCLSPPAPLIGHHKYTVPVPKNGATPTGEEWTHMQKQSRSLVVNSIVMYSLVYRVFVCTDNDERYELAINRDKEFLRNFIVLKRVCVCVQDDMPLLANVLASIKRAPECQIKVQCYGFNDNFPNALSLLPAITSCSLVKLASDRVMSFTLLLDILQHARYIEIDVRNFTFEDDPAVLLHQWKRAPTISDFIVYNMPIDASRVNLRYFVEQKVLPTGKVEIYWRDDALPSYAHWTTRPLEPSTPTWMPLPLEQE